MNEYEQDIALWTKVIEGNARLIAEQLAKWGMVYLVKELTTDHQSGDPLYGVEIHGGFKV